mgnify:CR=1 FL=1
MQILGHRSPHSARLERWFGKERLAEISQLPAGPKWDGPPIHLLDALGVCA